MKVFHLADIHWRGLKRHAEYREVFKKLFSDARNLKPDRIVVAGDIFHTKTQGITPEFIRNMVWCFEEMASICPVIVTLGNHDGLILNKSRLDAISPIIDALKNDRIIFLKDSCVYEDTEYPVAWCNFSCFDEEGWPNVCPVSGKINIALFHGCVRGSLTDSDWELNENEIDIGKFKDYDFGMFGDIHKFQYLDTEKRFAYPGSLIQQNYGESVDKGYLFWKINSKDDWSCERKIIKNPHPFITVPWRGTISETMEEIEQYPQGSRFRISANVQLMQDEFKELSSFLKEKMSAEEVAWKIEEGIDSSTIQLDDSSIEKTSLRDHKTHSNLLRQFFSQEDFTQDDWKEIDTLIENNLAAINENESPRNTKWSIKKMSWDNTYSYGKNNVIDFGKVNGVVGLFGPNRSGKSSIPGTLMYGLFNTSDRGPIKNIHIVNVRKGHCTVTIDFSVNGKLYRSERQTVKSTNKKGITGAATQMNIYSIDENGNVLSDLSGEQRRESDKILRNLIGSSEDFLLTTFASQGEMNSFIRERASARKVYLSSFLDIGIFEKMFSKLKEESYNLKSIMKTPKIDYAESISALESEIQSIEERKEKLIPELEDLRQNLTDLNVALATHKTSGIVVQSDVDEKESQVNDISSKITDFKDKLNELEDEEEKLRQKIQKISTLKIDFPIEELREDLTLLRNLQTKEAETRGKLQSEGVTLKNQERSIAKLNSVPCGDQFPQCRFIQDSHRDKKLIIDQRTIIENLQDNLKIINDQMTDLKSRSLEKKISKYEEILKSENSMIEKISSISKETEYILENISMKSSKLLELEKELAVLKSRVVATTESNEIDFLKDRIRKVSEDIKKNESEIVILDRSYGTSSGKIDFLRSEYERYVKNKKEWNRYEKLLSAYGKNGIPLMILTNELPKINAEIGRILHGVTGFTVVLEADPNSNDLEILLDYGDSRRPVELGSGMEKMMSSLAIRVALINISCLPKADMLIIDEGFGALDDSNIEACNRLLSSLKRYFKNILVISHVDEIKEAVDSMIEINTSGTDSHVCFI